MIIIQKIKIQGMAELLTHVSAGTPAGQQPVHNLTDMDGVPSPMGTEQPREWEANAKLDSCAA